MNIRKNSAFKHGMRLFILVVASILIASVLMYMLYSIPTGRAFASALNSVDMYGEDLIANWSGDAIYSRLSNHTDSLMIMHALYRPYDTKIENAFLTPSPDYGLSQPENLVHYLYREEPLASADYARYWHGYLLYLIPALQFFDVGEIKTLMMYAQIILLTFVVYELGKRSKAYILFYCTIALFINPITTVMTFQNADIYCIMMIFMFILLKYNDWLSRNNRYLYFFALNGILVAFVDYLTYPMAAYGVPLITVLLINDYKFKDSVKIVVYNSFAWIWGYAGMWAGKWIMCDLLTGSDSIASALSGVTQWTAADMSVAGFETTSYGFTLSYLFDYINEPPMIVLGLMIAVMFCICMYQGRFRFKNPAGFLSSTAAIALVGLAPFAWYFVLRNHTLIHPHLAYRQLAVSIWALLAISVKSCSAKPSADQIPAGNNTL